jgi:septal ring factor EnvC (AmiA/AmiB activator)
VIEQWQTVAEDLKSQVQALTTEVKELHEQVRQATTEHAEIRAQLAACLERDKSTRHDISDIQNRLGDSNYGNLTV